MIYFIKILFYFALFSKQTSLFVSKEANILDGIDTIKVTFKNFDNLLHKFSLIPDFPSRVFCKLVS